MADKENIVELPVGKLTGTLSTVQNSDGESMKVLSFKCSTADLHAWEQREHGIDDKIRRALIARNEDLQKMTSDLGASQYKKDPTIGRIDVDYGMGQGAMHFEIHACKVSHYPQKQDDGTVVRAEKKVFGAMKCVTRDKISKEVRQYHEANQAKIEAAVSAVFKKAALK